MNTLYETLCRELPEEFHRRISQILDTFYETRRLVGNRVVVCIFSKQEFDDCALEDVREEDLEDLARWMLHGGDIDWREVAESALQQCGYTTRNMPEWDIEGFETTADAMHWISNDGYAKYLSEMQKEIFDGLDEDDWKEQLGFKKLILGRAGWIEKEPFVWKKGPNFNDL